METTNLSKIRRDKSKSPKDLRLWDFGLVVQKCNSELIT